MNVLGMTRRVYTYRSGLGWDAYNLVETIGGYILAATGRNWNVFLYTLAAVYLAGPLLWPFIDPETPIE